MAASKALFFAALLAGVPSCCPGPPPVDAGVTDAAIPDAGTSEAGVSDASIPDAAPTDANPFNVCFDYRLMRDAPIETCSPGVCWQIVPNCCNGYCTNLLWDQVNCGICGLGCGVYYECVLGKCRPRLPR